MCERDDKSTYTSASICGSSYVEMMEDLEDAADAKRIISESDPSTWHTLDELREVVRGERNKQPAKR